MNNLILVNKNNSICVNYIPNDLESCDKGLDLKFYYDSYLSREAFINFLKLRKDAILKNYDIYAYSGFRSGKDQQKTFNNFYEKYLLELKEKNSELNEEELKKEAYKLTTLRVALPGQSEHQTGLAVDIACFYKENYSEDLADIGEVEWMRENAHKYGFILRYPKGKEDITGYNFEPWHYRYIGEEYAYDVVNKGLTFEEYHKYVLKK